LRVEREVRLGKVSQFGCFFYSFGKATVLCEAMEGFLQNLSVGRRAFDDPFFDDGNRTCGFFERLCTFDIDEEELCHNVYVCFLALKKNKKKIE